MTRVSAIHVEGFRSVRNATALLGPTNILVGPNGAGKSNLILLCRMLSAAAKGVSSLRSFVSYHGGANRLLHGGSKVTSEVACELGFQTDAGNGSYRVTLRSAADDELSVSQDSVQGFGAVGVCTGLPLTSSEIGVGAERLLTAQQHIQEFVRGIGYFHFSDTSLEGPLRRRTPADDTLTLHENGGNLPGILLRLREEAPDAYRRIVNSVENAAPWFADFHLEPEGGAILLRCSNKTGQTLTASQLSDGTIRFIALATALQLPAGRRPSLLAIDEPELGLHPAAEGIIARLIRSAASEGTQMIVATQSPTFLSHFEPEDVLVVENENGESSFHRHTREELAGWLERYSLGQIWMKNLMGGRP